MQVLFLPSGTEASRNIQFTLRRMIAVAAGVLIAVGAGCAYLGFSIGQYQGGQVAGPSATEPHDERAAQAAVMKAARADAAPARPRVVNYAIADKQHAVNARRLADLRDSLDEQRRMLRESRRRMSDQVDSLGQRLGEIQAHVLRLNAFGQRLTEMAGMDPAEFSFDRLPAVGGPERTGPWEQLRAPELGDSLAQLEVALREKENELSILEALLADRELHQKQYPQGWPTSSGWMSSAYGKRTDPFTGRAAFHEGVDIAARDGSKIRAMAAGVVTFAGKKSGYGLMVEINHGNGFQTRYAHAKKVIAEVGDRVEKGDTVALVGSTGRSTGSHVHFEVIKNGKVVNPHEHLNASG